MPTLTTGTYPAYAEGYINLVDAQTVSEAITKYSKDIINFFVNVPAEKIDYRYAPNKWSIKVMLQHIIDTERIFAYRALRISRGDKTPLPGFNENDYAAASNAENRDWNGLLEEFKIVRQSTDLLLQSFTNEQLNRVGITNEQPNSTLALSFTIFGHILHHINIIKERYF